MANNSLRQLSDALNMATAQLSGDPQRMQMALGMQQSRKLQEQDRQWNEWIDVNVKDQDKAKLLKLLGREAGIKSYLNTDKSTFERFTLYDKITGKPEKTINKAEAGLIDRDKFIIGPLANPFPETQQDDGFETWAITDKEGNRYKDLVNPTEEEIRSLIDQGYFLNKTPALTTAGKAKDTGIIKGWNDQGGLQGKAIAYNTLTVTGQRIIDNLYNNPESVLATGDIAQVFNQIGEEFKAIEGLFNDDEKNAFIFSSPEGQNNKEIRLKFAELAKQTAISESQLLDFAYQIAKVRGQEGRGLSDQDFRNFQKIISAGRTAEQKAAALYDFISGVGTEIKSEMDLTRRLKEIELKRNPQNKTANAYVTGINDLYKVGFGTLNNPFMQGMPQQVPSTTGGPRIIIRQLNP